MTQFIKTIIKSRKCTFMIQFNYTKNRLESKILFRYKNTIKRAK